VCSSGEVLPEKKEAKPNPAALEHRPKAEDKSDNAKSLGFLLKFGEFRFLDLGDLTWNIEYKLVHPSDKIGKVDVYQSTHHGLEISNNPVVINTVQPRVAVFNNGPKKGCHAAVTSALRRVPGIEGIYQLHRNVTVGALENTEPERIANDSDKCEGKPIVLTVSADAQSYTVKVGEQKNEFRHRVRDRK
jgi:hypothetical protein